LETIADICFIHGNRLRVLTTDTASVSDSLLLSLQLFAVVATFKSIDYNVATTLNLNNNNNYY